MSSTYGPITSAGTVTSYLPLTTAWSAPAQCSSLYLQAGGNLFLNAPQSYDGSPACNPPEISPWWYQSPDPASPTTTLLGGYDFYCPEAYTTVFSWVTAFTTTIGCCPSDYSYAGTWWRAGFPSQCESSIPTGTVTFVQPADSGTVYTTTSTSLSTPSVIWGVQVNGFRIQPPQTSVATTTSGGDSGVSRSTQTGDGSGTTSSSSTSTSESSKSSSSNLSTGSIVGIVTGSVSAVATVLGLVFRVYKYKKKQRQQQLVQEGTPSIKETITRLCANCGSVTSTEFCTKCGARVTVR